MPRQPLYPHIPKSRITRTRFSRDDLRFLPDSPEAITQTVRSTGYQDELEHVFRAAMARAKGIR